MKMTWVNESCIFITSAILVSFFIRKLICISHIKHLFDEPLEARRSHKTKTPNLGGIAIAGAMAFTTCFFISAASVAHFNYIFLSLLVLFLMGVTDDLIGISAMKKLLAQAAAAAIVILAGYRFTNFYGFFGWSEMTYAASFAVSIFFITLVINAFNLIDGINCLAGSLSLMASACFAFYFRQMNDGVFASFAVALCGGLSGFLWFNKSPAKIFMGDTGSMFVGFLMSLFSIHVLELSRLPSSAVSVSQMANMVTALLIIPVYDTARVFVLRIARSRSPFTADRNHIHHRLIDAGLSHMQATGLLVVVNILLIIVALAMYWLRPDFFAAVAFVLLTVFNGILSVWQTRKRNLFMKEKKLAEHEAGIRVIISEKSVVNI